jgi:ectoine hydroxylase
MTMFSKKGSKGQAWFQDCPPIAPSQKNFNLNYLVYSMDINEQIGRESLVMLGSHQHGTLLADEIGENFT